MIRLTKCRVQLTLLFVAGFLAFPAAADGHAHGVADPKAEPSFQPLPNEQLLAGLRAGGHVIYFRHAQTEKDYADQVTADPNDGSTQRVLSEYGWHQAKRIGVAIQELEIPVGDVVTSEYFRAWQTADLAFGRYEKTAALNFEPAEQYTPEQFAAMRTRVMPLVTAAPEPGVNTVIVGHDDPFESVTGIYPEPQGVAYVLKPDGEGGFTILARVGPDEWLGLDAE
ncbi:MAG: histidine phosphatase family protein [Planctomycetota bacterium]